MRRGCISFFAEVLSAVVHAPLLEVNKVFHIFHLLNNEHPEGVFDTTLVNRLCGVVSWVIFMNLLLTQICHLGISNLPSKSAHEYGDSSSTTAFEDVAMVCSGDRHSIPGIELANSRALTK